MHYCRDPSAVDRVFATVELAELIFKDLSLEDITRVTRTCQHFNNIVLSSKAILKGHYWFKSKPAKVIRSDGRAEDWRKVCGRSKPSVSYIHGTTLPELQYFYMSLPTRTSKSLRFDHLAAGRLRHPATSTYIDASREGNDQLWRHVKVFASDEPVRVKLTRHDVGEKDVRGKLPVGATLGEVYDWLCSVNTGGKLEEEITTKGIDEERSGDFVRGLGLNQAR